MVLNVSAHPSQSGPATGPSRAQPTAAPGATPAPVLLILVQDPLRRQQLAQWCAAAGFDCRAYAAISALPAPGHVDPRDPARPALLDASDLAELMLIDSAQPTGLTAQALAWAREQGQGRIGVLALVPPGRAEASIAALLQAGADDYLEEPSTPVLARAKLWALLRRVQQRQVGGHRETYGEFLFDLDAHEVLRSRERIHLTPKEFSVALLLFRHQGQPMSRLVIQQSVWQHAAPLITRTIDTHVCIVRAKLRLRPEHGYRLKTIYGFGYRLERVSEVERRALCALG
ncbi:MAG: response regulator transcription factor [Bordetella sp.]|nr:response regulator transcription factor [Bordetella sp.]